MTNVWWRGSAPRDGAEHTIRSGVPELLSLFLHALPGTLHVASLSGRLADAESEGEFTVEFRVREEKVAAGIQPVHQCLIGLIPRAQPEADEIELGRCGDFEA